MSKRSDTDKAIRNIMNWSARSDWAEEQVNIFDAHLVPVCERLDISKEELAQELAEQNITGEYCCNKYH